MNFSLSKTFMSKPRITVSWSGGKDAAFCLYKILQDGVYEVVSLHTVFGTETRRVGLHGIHEDLMEAQAKAIGIPLTKLYLEKSQDHAAYEKLMKSFYKKCTEEDIQAIAFGDIFLEDLKKYREDLLEGSGIFPVYPIWKEDTTLLLQKMIEAGFKTVVCAANGNWQLTDWLGQTIGKDFSNTLQPEVDPCGENGEFHTFVYDGPIFKHPVAYEKGKVVSESYSYQKIKDDGSTEELETTYWFQDLLPLMAS